MEWRPAAIYHFERSRYVQVLAQLAEGTTSNQVLEELNVALAEIDLPAGVRLELGGELEESGSANAAILTAMPLGVLLLLFFLLAEFNSFRRVGIVLVTVPLAAVGVVPGLLLSGHDFGFMPMLGVVSLVGIVVNNAIVLLDVVEALRREGFPMDQALTEAVRRRTRPILLTMMTTVAGLLPLALSETSLWPPLAWAMISGLTASTVLTLVVVPALYKVLFTPRARPSFGSFSRRRAAAASLFLCGIASVATQPVAAATTLTLTLEEAILRAIQRPRLVAAESRATARGHDAVAERRQALWPTVNVGADLTRRDRDYDFSTPLGGFVLGDRTSSSLNLEVVQPLLDPAQLFYRSKAARSEASAAAHDATRVRQQLAAEVSRSFLQLVGIDANRRSTEAFIASLQASLSEMEERVAAGRILESEALKVRLDLESAQLDQRALEETRRAALYELGRAVGHDGPVEPRVDGSFERTDDFEAESLVAAALATRPDLAQLLSRLRARELRTEAVRAERYPRLSARATWSRADGDPFRPDELVEGRLAVSWNPFSRGRRAPRIASLSAEVEALEADLVELERTIVVQVRNALARFETARAAADVRRRGVELATETRRVERERNRVGRSTTNDLLDAEATLRRQRTASELARIDILAAWFELGLAVGVSDFRQLSDLARPPETTAAPSDEPVESF